MVTKNELEIGGVYYSDLSKEPVRIITFDDYQVYYDTWWEHCNDWGATNYLKKKFFYFRTTAVYFLKTAKKIRTEPLSEMEFKVFRSDLPLNICRNSQLQWTNKMFLTIEDYKVYLSDKQIFISDNEQLNIPEIIIVPFGLNASHKKSVVIKAINGTCFSAIELLWNSQNAQAPYINKETTEGVGLHRLGFEKGLPSFYIGGYYDSAKVLKDL